MSDKDILIEQINDLLRENNYVADREVLLSIAIYVLEREKKAIQSIFREPA